MGNNCICVGCQGWLTPAAIIGADQQRYLRTCCRPRLIGQTCVGCSGEVVGILQRTGTPIVASLSEGDEKALASSGGSDRQARAHRRPTDT